MPETAEETYDFIVTGAGSAGCVIAARLSESGRHRVLLLEAGPPDSNPWIHIPLGFAKTYVDPAVNWRFETEPQPQLGSRQLYLPRGKTLGGSSSINGMVYIRGNHGDYDEWRQRGCENWDWDFVLPYFKKAENQTHGANEFHGVGGPLHVSDQPEGLELAGAVLRPVCRPAFRVIPTSTAQVRKGVAITRRPAEQAALEHGESLSGTRARTLQPRSADRRPCHTRVDREQPRRRRRIHTAQGRRAARARGEIIVSGGAYGSPQLLLLSGLGPAQHLQDVGVPVVRDMPAVGSNLHDHFNCYLSWRCSKPITLNDLENSLLRKAMAGVRYGLFRSGPMASNGIHVACSRARIHGWSGPICRSTYWNGAS